MKRLLIALLSLLVISTTLWASTLSAQGVTGSVFAVTRDPVVNPDALREMLEKGLKVTRDDEKAYINGVVDRVVKKKLSLSIVYASFKYARTRRPYYPFPYFVFSVETLEKRQKN